jgi:hypothetical protein
VNVCTDRSAFEQAFSYQNFSIAWNYVEADHPGQLPYWAALFAPWVVTITAQATGSGTYLVHATISYPLVMPFQSRHNDDATLTSFAAIELSDDLLLSSSEQMQVQLGPLKPVCVLPPDARGWCLLTDFFVSWP